MIQRFSMAPGQRLEMCKSFEAFHVFNTNLKEKKNAWQSVVRTPCFCCWGPGVQSLGQTEFPQAIQAYIESPYGKQSCKIPATCLAPSPVGTWKGSWRSTQSCVQSQDWKPWVSKCFAVYISRACKIETNRIIWTNQNAWYCLQETVKWALFVIKHVWD